MNGLGIFAANGDREGDDRWWELLRWVWRDKQCPHNQERGWECVPLPLGVSHWGGPCIQEMEAMLALKLRKLFKIPLRHGHVLSYQ